MLDQRYYTNVENIFNTFTTVMSTLFRWKQENLSWYHKPISYF